MTGRRLHRTATHEPTTLSRWVEHVPHLWLDIRGSWDARLQPQRGALTQPRRTAWVNEVVPLRFAKALKGRDQSSERASYAVSREAYSALSGLNANCRTGSRTQAVGLGCAGAAPLGLSALTPPVASQRCGTCSARGARALLDSFRAAGAEREGRQSRCRTPEMRKQSENVYENKESRSRGVEQPRSSEVEESSSCEAKSRGQASKCRRLAAPQPSTLDFST